MGQGKGKGVREGKERGREGRKKGREGRKERHTPVIPAVGRLRQEDCKAKASLSYIVRSCLKRWDRDREHLPKLLALKDMSFWNAMDN
jgi:hypothetical protein